MESRVIQTQDLIYLTATAARSTRAWRRGHAEPATVEGSCIGHRARRQTPGGDKSTESPPGVEGPALVTRPRRLVDQLAARGVPLVRGQVKLT